MDTKLELTKCFDACRNEAPGFIAVVLSGARRANVAARELPRRAHFCRNLGFCRLQFDHKYAGREMKIFSEKSLVHCRAEIASFVATNDDFR